MEYALVGTVPTIMEEGKRALIDRSIQCPVRSCICHCCLQFMGHHKTHSLTNPQVCRKYNFTMNPERVQNWNIWQTLLMIATWDYFSGSRVLAPKGLMLLNPSVLIGLNKNNKYS